MGVDNVLANLKKARIKKGGHLYSPTELLENTVVIPFPDEAQALMWVLGGINGVPIGRVFGLSGPPSAGKSTFSYWLGNCALEHGGFDAIADTENKASPTAFAAIRRALPTDKRDRGVLELTNEDDNGVGSAFERATELLTGVCAQMHALRKDGVLPKGERIPYRIAMDSVVGSANENDKQALLEKGRSEERGYATINNQIKKFFEGQLVANTTGYITYVTHLKEDQGANSPSYMARPMKELGGKSPEFFATAVLRFTPVGDAKEYIDDDGYLVRGKLIKLQAHKSAMGESKRQIRVPLLWRYVVDPDEPDADPEQEMWFDWHWALGWLVWKFLNDAKWTVAGERDQFKALFAATSDCGSEKSPKFKEKAKAEGDQVLLGADAKGVGMREFGQLIMASEEARTRLHRLLCIKRFSTVQEAEPHQLPGGRGQIDKEDLTPAKSRRGRK